MSPQKNPKVKKSLSVNTCLLGALSGPTRMPNLRNYCYKIQIFLSYVERCSRSGMGIIAFKHGNPTLIWIIVMRRIGTSPLMPLFLDTTLKWPWGMHNIDKKSMIQKEKLLNESWEAQLELEKLTLQTTTNWEGIVMENQTKAILYDQFVEDMSIELANVMKGLRCRGGILIR